MASLPGFRFDVTGASGAAAHLSPKDSYRCYVLPQGGYASQDSAGTLITFDSASVASRFAVNSWIQAGLLTSNIRQVGAVGGNSISVSGAALTVSENMRIYLIGNTEPTVSGGSATYTTPNTLVRQRDDDAADLYTNSMLTTDSNGMVQGFAQTALYDLLIQDGNGTLQGSLIDLPVGVPEGISVSDAAIFGATVTIRGNLGVSGTATFGATTTTKILNGTRYMNMYATSGTGASGSPWAGWESAAVEGVPIHFPAGYYTTSGHSISVSLSNTPSKTRITGDGSGATIITITGGSGQFRVYGTGAGTRVLQSVHIDGLNITAGANNSSVGIFSVENLDAGSYVGDILVDTTSAFGVTTAIQILNCENCHFGMLTARGWSASPGAAGNILTGLYVGTNDGIQRGNMNFAQCHLTNVTVGLSISSSGGSLDNLFFGIMKVVNGSLVNGTTAVSLGGNAEQITFADLHMEAFNNGLYANSVENVTVINGIASQISNAAVSAGTAYRITNGDGGKIFSRLNACYNGYVLDGTTTRFIIQQGTVAGVTTHFTDSSSGSNMLMNGGAITGAVTFNSRSLASAAFGFGTAGTAVSVSGGTITVTKDYHQIDNSGGVVTVSGITGLNDGDPLILRPNIDGNTVTFNESGNIRLISGTSLSFALSSDLLVLLKVGSTFYDLARAVNH